MIRNFNRSGLRILLFCETVILLVGSLPARSQGANSDFFPLMAWDDVEDEATVQKMAECGINVIAFVPTNMLYACDKYHVKAIVFDPLVTPNWDKPFDSIPAFVVLFLFFFVVFFVLVVWG